MKKMEYQSIIDGLSVTAMACLIWAILCFIGIGIATQKRDKAFEEQQKEYNEKMNELNQRY